MSANGYEDAKKVARANLGFYRAFEALDVERMASIWVRECYVKCVHPGAEMLVGFDAVMASWRAIFQHTDRIQFHVHDVDVRVVGDCAWVTLVESVEGGFSEHERGTTVAATNVFERRGGGWRMVLHHASPMLRRVTTEAPPESLPDET
jgi:ketosteroid isomerase-like protein